MGRARIALTVGDPAGIGPEIVAQAFRDPRVDAVAELIGIGPPQLGPGTCEGTRHSWIDCEAPATWDMGRVQSACGAAALDALRIGHRMALAGEVDALVTAPLSKAAMHAAGEHAEGQTELLSRWSEVERTGMLVVVDTLRVLLLTRHAPLVEAVRSITPEAVVDHLELLDEALRRMGIGAPHLALPGLNPHAGEGGLFGDEEAELLEPALERARERGLDVDGPIPPDSVFVGARAGRWDGVLALYHDQAFIPLKLLSADRGVTVIAGLPYLRVSPVHGTAFDIAGKGVASAENLVHALLHAAHWSGAQSVG